MKHRAAPRRCQAAHANSAFYKKSTARFGQSGEGWISLEGTERCYAWQDAPFFTERFGEFAASQRAGRAAGPYRTPANPYCPAKFDCKADLPQQFKRNYLQICCTVTGGAYHSARRVSPCVRNGYKTGASLNCTRSTHQTVPQRPCSPPSFPARRKRRGRRRLVENGLDGTSLRCSRSLLSCLGCI